MLSEVGRVGIYREGPRMGARCQEGPSLLAAVEWACRADKGRLVREGEGRQGGEDVRIQEPLATKTAHPLVPMTPIFHGRPVSSDNNTLFEATSLYFGLVSQEMPQRYPQDSEMLIE